MWRLVKINCHPERESYSSGHIIMLVIKVSYNYEEEKGVEPGWFSTGDRDPFSSEPTGEEKKRLHVVWGEGSRSLTPVVNPSRKSLFHPPRALSPQVGAFRNQLITTTVDRRLGPDRP